MATTMIFDSAQSPMIPVKPLITRFNLQLRDVFLAKILYDILITP
jgi:hypothetical protein